jgi:four helix bundle protein
MEENKKRADPLRDKTLAFAVRIVKLNRYLREEKKEYVLSKQILRSGTNPGAMVREASNAESGSDFIHKLSIGQKENGETQYWLELLYLSDYLTDKEYESLNTDSIEISKLLTSSIRTKKSNIGRNLLLLVLVLVTQLFGILDIKHSPFNIHHF